MRAHGVKRIAFSSTGSVYGETLVTPDRPTPEDAPFPLQTSLYAASKVAGESLLSAYAEAGQIDEAYIFRFVSILGERYTHGHVFDFHRQLVADPTRLRVLGDGRQRKSYLYVQDCVSAMLTALNHHGDAPGAHVYNLGRDEIVTVDESIATITGHLGLDPEIARQADKDRGWAGDSPLIHLDTTKLESLGWAPTLTIRDAITRTLDWFEREPGIVLQQEPSHS
jgi:UDP-glucose 4-epimerase